MMKALTCDELNNILDFGFLIDVECILRLMDDFHSLQGGKYCLIHSFHNSWTTHVFDVLHKSGMLVVNAYAAFLDVISLLKSFSQSNVMMVVNCAICCCSSLCAYCCCCCGLFRHFH